MTDRVSRYSVKVSDTTIGEILMIENEPVARKEIISALSEEEFHGSAGVYYHITNREGPPLVYAGKAYHLGRRAMKKSRIESVSQNIPDWSKEWVWLNGRKLETAIGAPHDKRLVNEGF